MARIVDEFYVKQNEILETIRAAREAADWKQHKLGYLIGASRTTVSRYECRHSSPTLLMTLRMLDALGYTVEVKRK